LQKNGKLTDKFNETTSLQFFIVHRENFGQYLVMECCYEGNLNPLNFPPIRPTILGGLTLGSVPNC